MNRSSTEPSPRRTFATLCSPTRSSCGRRSTLISSRARRSRARFRAIKCFAHRGPSVKRLLTPQCSEQILEMGAPARPVVSSRPLLEKTWAARSLEHPDDTLVCRKIARLVLSHVQVKSSPHTEAAQKPGNFRLFDMKGAGLAADPGEQMGT